MLLACIDKKYQVGLCQVFETSSGRRCYLAETIQDIVAWGFIQDFERPIDCLFTEENGFDTLECRGCPNCLGVTNDGKIKCIKDKNYGKNEI
jgi:hypothetical protein